MDEDDFCDTFCWPYVEETDAFTLPLRDYLENFSYESGQVVLSGSHMRTCPITRAQTFVFRITYIGNDNFDLLGWKLVICVEQGHENH